MSWDFGGAYADTYGKLQEQEFKRLSAPIDRAHTEATTRYNNALAGHMEHNVGAKQRMAALAQSAGPLDADTPSASILRLANLAMQAGDPETASALILRSTQAQENEAQVERFGALTSKTRAELAIKKAERYADLMQGVQQSPDPAATFARANQLFEREFGERAPTIQYDPRTVDLLRKSAISMRDQERERHNREMEKAAEERIKNIERDRQLRREAQEAERARKDAAAARKAAEGGKAVGAPSATEVKQALDFLKTQGAIKGSSPAERDQAAQLAAKARALYKTTGVDAGEARARAFAEMMKEGTFTSKPQGGLRGLFGGKSGPTSKPSSGAVGSPTNPLPTPKNLAEAKDGLHYVTPRGVLKRVPGGWQAPEAE